MSVWICFQTRKLVSFISTNFLLNFILLDIKNLLLLFALMGLVFNVHCFLVKVNVSKELFHEEISVVYFTLGSWEILGRLVRLKNKLEKTFVPLKVKHESHFRRFVWENISYKERLRLDLYFRTR